MTLKDDVLQTLEAGVDSLACQLHNDGSDLTGNTAGSDIAWLAARLFEASTLGACDMRFRDWRINPEEFAELKLHPQGVWHPERFDQLPEEKREAWIKLARVVTHVMPEFAERVGHRMMKQAEAVRAVWKELRVKP